MSVQLSGRFAQSCFGIAFRFSWSRYVRFLKSYSIVTTLLLIVVAFAGFRQASQKVKFTKVDVERINVVDEDGKVKMVISNSERRHPGVIDGKDAQGAPKLEFLDEKGAVVQRLPAAK